MKCAHEKVGDFCGSSCGLILISCPSFSLVRLHRRSPHVETQHTLQGLPGEIPAG